MKISRLILFISRAIIKASWGNYMSHSYTAELEELILNKLLPAYVKYEQSKGNTNPLKGINPSILSQIRAKRKLPALLLP